MKKYLFISVLLGCYMSCLSAQPKTYFPAGANDTLHLNTFEVKWFSEQLAALEEPVIFNDSTGFEGYRFTWLRTFHNPIAIRIEKQGDEYWLFWKKCDGAGGYAPGEIITDRKRKIEIKDWAAFQKKVDSIDFWKMPARIRNYGNDGAEWILEGRVNGTYHVVDRWSPDSANAYFRCCYFLVQLTRMKIRERDVY